jgi:hypothetical protein
VTVSKEILREWIIEALEARGGSATLVDVCRHIWQNHEDDLWDSGDLFYTWQYDVRWAATDLRSRGVLKRIDEERARGVWELRSLEATAPSVRDPIRSCPSDGSELDAQPEPVSQPWSRDELILALDLYRRRGNLNARHREVVVLSDDLRSLPLDRARPSNYRSPASVTRKLGNFASIDPKFPGTGLPAAGKLDRAVFEQFLGRPDALAAEVACIRARYELPG